MQLNKITPQSLLYHILFWVIYVIFNAYLWQTFDRTYNETHTVWYHAPTGKNNRGLYESFSADAVLF